MIKKLTTFITDNTEPYQNLAVEEYLMFHTEASECILYLWQNRHTVVIGKNQNAWKECNVTKLEADGGYLTRRLSGGGAVFHDLGNLNFTFCVKEEDYSVEKQTQVILEAVRLLGIQAERTGRNDITVDGRKFSGNAFYKSKGYCYHHGTILIDVDQNKMSEYLYVSKAKLQSKGVRSVKSRTVNLKELKPDLTVAMMKDALEKAFQMVYETAEEVQKISEERLNWDEIKKIEERFSSWDWKYGRKIPFDHSIEQRFVWGGIEIQFHVSGGIIRDLQIFTDAMEVDLANKLETCWRGCEYKFGEILQKLEDTAFQSENEKQIKEDLKKLLSEQF